MMPGVSETPVIDYGSPAKPPLLRWRNVLIGAVVAVTLSAIVVFLLVKFYHGPILGDY